MESQALPISCCKKKKKKGVRGEAPFSTKSMSALVHFDPSHTHSTIQTEGRHHQNSSALSPRAFKDNFFLMTTRVGSTESNVVERVGGGSSTEGADSEAETTHMNTRHARQAWLKTETCLLQSVFLSAQSLLFFFSPPNRKINVKPRGTIVWTSNQELSLLSLPWH